MNALHLATSIHECFKIDTRMLYYDQIWRDCLHMCFRFRGSGFALCGPARARCPTWRSARGLKGCRISRVHLSLRLEVLGLKGLKLWAQAAVSCGFAFRIWQRKSIHEYVTVTEINTRMLYEYEDSKKSFTITKINTRMLYHYVIWEGCLHMGSGLRDWGFRFQPVS